MTNLEKYQTCFQKTLELPMEQINETLTYQGVESWDSVGHMNLIAELEDVFEIMFETEDIIDFNSYAKGIELLKKYDIIIE